MTDLRTRIILVARRREGINPNDERSLLALVEEIEVCEACDDLDTSELLNDLESVAADVVNMPLNEIVDFILRHAYSTERQQLQTLIEQFAKDNNVTV